MTKKTKTPYGILTESIGLYFSNSNKFLKYMTFPVLGQVIGLGIIFTITYFYSQNLPKLLEKYPNLNSMSYLVLMSILVTLPGLIIFTKAFWEYLVAYGAINSMLDNMLRSGRVYDFSAHTELIKRRTIAFAGLWLLAGCFSVIAVCPLFWVICGILAVYFVLTFQVFTFEPELSPIGCVKRSANLIKGHFVSTFILICVIGLITYLFIPQIILKIVNILGIDIKLANIILPLTSLIPEINLAGYGIKAFSHQNISQFIIQSLIAQIAIGYTLPMRSVLWGMWYKELAKNSSFTNEKNRKRKANRPSEKLMEESHKKFSKKKIDNNVLKRAMEKED